MTDREMLELAAKAIGQRIIAWNNRYDIPVAVLENGSFWQPLLENGITDCMGDALRLAVRLGIADLGNFFDGEEADPYAATRRAITRAAAEIGKSMEGET